MKCETKNQYDSEEFSGLKLGLFDKCATSIPEIAVCSISQILGNFASCGLHQRRSLSFQVWRAAAIGRWKDMHRVAFQRYP